MAAHLMLHESNVPFGALRQSPAVPRIGRWTLALLLAWHLAGCGGSGPEPAKAGPPPALPPVAVKTAVPLQKQVVEWDEYTGRIEARESVEIRARVSGYLERVNFRDGDRVKKGDLLFVIDPRPYRAEAGRIEAELERARTRLDLARNSLERAEHLRKSRAISEEDYDGRSKAVREGAAAVRAAEATAETARLNLGYTEIRAPIAGRIGRELITVGNLVNADQTLLTQIVSIDPVYVYVDANERAVLRYRRLTAGRRGSGGEVRIPAELALLDEQGFPHRGHLDYAEPRLDTGSGTLRVRGVFPNPDELLSPGLFARLRIHAGEPRAALLIPDRAIGTDQGQKFVWIAKPDATIEYRRVVPGLISGGLRAITAGLKADEAVVIEGLQKLRPGARIKAESVVLTATD